MGRNARERWETEGGQRLAEEVLARLVSGRTLGDLELEQVDGRVDLRGLPAPTPKRLARFESGGWFIERLGDLVKLRDVELRGLDLSGAFLDSFRFWNCVIEDCVLDGARCHDWRMWECQVRGTSFCRSDIRNSVLGPWKQGKGNEFSRVDFSKADLRKGTPMTAVFKDCDFSAAKLDKAEFLRCGLERCRFAGVLKEVIFDGRVFDAEQERMPNYCEDVDMLAAIFRLVEFRGFDLTGVKVPADPGLHIIENYPCVLHKSVEMLRDRDDETGRVLRAILEGQRGRERGKPLGLFNRHDFVLLGGEELATLAESVIGRAELECAEVARAS